MKKHNYFHSELLTIINNKTAMKNQKLKLKGQSAIEYVLTYGWAIIIMSTAAVVLWQFGVFSFASMGGSGYSGFGEVNPVGFSYKANGTFECILTNDAGGAVLIDNVTVKIYDDVCSSSSLNLSRGESAKVTINTCPEGPQSDRYDLVLVIYFTDNETGVDHTSAGTLWGNYE